MSVHRIGGWPTRGAHHMHTSWRDQAGPVAIEVVVQAGVTQWFRAQDAPEGAVDVWPAFVGSDSIIQTDPSKQPVCTLDGWAHGGACVTYSGRQANEIQPPLTGTIGGWGAVIDQGAPAGDQIVLEQTTSYYDRDGAILYVSEVSGETLVTCGQGSASFQYFRGSEDCANKASVLLATGERAKVGGHELGLFVDSEPSQVSSEDTQPTAGTYRTTDGAWLGSRNNGTVGLSGGVHDFVFFDNVLLDDATAVVVSDALAYMARIGE